MKHAGKDTGVIPAVTAEVLSREKEKARALRKTQWWQRQIARGTCHYCGRQVHPQEMTLDHIVPLIRGGRSVRGNVAPACKTCNTRKKYLLPMEWDDYLSNFRTESSAQQSLSEPASEPEGNDHGRV